MVCNNYRRNSKLKLCTSHGFSYSNLEDTVINYIKNLFKKIDSEKIELEVKKGMTKYDYGKSTAMRVPTIGIISVPISAATFIKFTLSPSPS